MSALSAIIFHELEGVPLALCSNENEENPQIEDQGIEFFPRKFSGALRSVQVGGSPVTSP